MNLTQRLHSEKLENIWKRNRREKTKKKETTSTTEGRTELFQKLKKQKQKQKTNKP